MSRLRSRARQAPERPAYTFLASGEREAAALTFGELDREARALGAALARRGARGERVLLLLPPGLDFVTAFTGCLVAGAVAVPSYPPRPRGAQERLRAIAADARPGFVLTVGSLAARSEPLLEAVPELRQACWLDARALVETEGEGADLWEEPGPEPGDLALLQYTSGSTADPKGVMVTHGNLAHNQEQIRRAFGQSASSVVVSWLPLYHDMGLIGGVLQPLWVGARCVLMSPMAFLQRPARWLEAVSRYRATTSGGPNFAYELAARRVGEEERRTLDLSCWRVAFNGAEPVRAETLERFARAFEPSGFGRRAFFPCYGLAEATLFVAGGGAGRGAAVREVDADALSRGSGELPRAGAATRSLVGCGRPWGGQEVAVADPETGARLPPGRVGEIWVAGASVARGYWEQPRASARDFGARLAGEAESGPFLRTGDLGFTAGGELFVTGRLKDLIVLRGRNHYPQDVEAAAEGAHPALRLGGAAAFAVDADGEERLAVVLEVERRAEVETAPVAEAVRREVARLCEAGVHEVALIAAGSLPRTSSGKVQRGRCRDLHLAGELPVVGRSAPSREPGAEGDFAQGLALAREELLRLEAGERRLLVGDALGRWAARALALAPERLERELPLTAQGLDSLGAAELERCLAEELGAAVGTARLLAGASLAELEAEVLAALEADAGEGEAPRLGEAGDSGEGPLSPGQEGLWLVTRLAPGQGALNLAAAARLEFPPEPEALSRALAALAERHGALRTTFHPGREGPGQRVHPRAAPTLERVDAAAWSGAELAEALAAAAVRPFDLEAAPPVRALLFAAAPGGAVLLLVAHHLVADFASLAVLVRELGALYGLERGEGPPLPPPPALTYLDVAAWQRRRLAGSLGEELRAYWRRELAGGLPDLDLPTDRPRPPAQGFRGGSVTLSLGPALPGAVRALGRRRGATPFMVLLAAFQALLARCSGQRRFGVGAPAAGRDAPGLKDLVGYLVSPVVLRADLTGDPGFTELLSRTRERVLGALTHAGLPPALLARELAGRRDGGRPPLFQVLFVLQQAEGPAAEALAALALGRGGGRLEAGGLALEPVPLPRRASELDLSLMAAELAGELCATLTYDADLFDSTTARRMLGHFRTLLEAVLEEPGRPVAELPLLAPAQRAQLLVEWGDGGPEPRAAPLLPDLFARRAAALPEAVALVWRGERWSYREIGCRSREVARALRQAGAGPETVVGVLAARTPALAVALLGVLEAGAAYLPLDPTYPGERLAFMLADGAVRTVVAGSGLAGRLACGGDRVPEVVEVDAAGGLVAAGGPPRGDGAPGPRPHPQNLAYVLYTSGSTGRPKGVAVTHRGAAALVAWAREAFGPAELAGVLAATSASFDLSVFELFAAWGAGGRVILAENALELPSLAAAGEVRLLNTVPSAAAELVRGGGLPRSLRTVNLAGEALPGGLADALYGVPGVERVINLYGPSEDTTYSTWAVIPRRRRGEPAIGRPLPGTRVYVTGGAFEPVPPGVAGELLLGGAGLARGYRGRPGLTAGRFVPDPWSARSGGRLCRSGDRVRFLPDGELAFLGRLDHQVKVRGFRVEPGEVEAALALHPEVAEAVVVARPGPAGEGGVVDLCLVAYAAPRPEVPAAGFEGRLRTHLAARLPAFMVPAAWVVLKALPRLPNGKVDRASLPEPTFDASTEDLPPAGPVEEILAGLWRELLEVEAVGREADFFALGGHSLLAARLTARVAESCGVELPLAAVFEAPTPAALAARVAAARRTRAEAPAPPLVREAGPGPGPLSFAQERMWLLERLAPGSPVYHLPGTVALAGRLRPGLLARCLAEIARRHEPLRTAVTSDDGRPRPRLLPAAAFPLPAVDLSRVPAGEREPLAGRLGAAEARRPFDLGGGPLLRGTLLRLAPGEHRLLLTAHHIAADGWSLEAVLVGELAALYAAGIEGGEPPLPALAIRYRDYARWQRRWLDGGVRAREIAFWRRELAGVPEVLELPVDRPGERPDGGPAGAAALGFSPLETGDLEVLARRRGATPFMVLLAALYALLARTTGQRDLPVGTPVAGRSRRETEPLVGLFVNTLVVRGDLSDDPGFGELVGRVRERCLAAFDHADLPFEVLVEALNPRRRLGSTPLFQVMLALGNLPAGELRLPGLEARRLAPRVAAVKFELSLLLEPAQDGGLAGRLLYPADRLDATTGARLAAAYRRLLLAAVAEPQRRLADLPLLSAAQCQQLLVEWSGAEQAPAWRGPVHARIAARGEGMPEAVAVAAEPAAGGDHLSFRELGLRVARLARRLAALGVGPEVRVATELERSTHAPATLLGVLAAGGSWVPLDPADPPARRALVLGDCGARVRVVAGAAAGSGHPAGVAGAEGDPGPEPLRSGAEAPVLDPEAAVAAADLPGPLRDERATALRSLPEPEAGSLAYVLYTSGSTGRPKGVMVSHGSLAAYLEWAGRALLAPPVAAVPLVTRLSFDACLKQVFAPLLAGRPVRVLATETLERPAALGRALAELPGVCFNAVPALWQAVLEAVEAGEAPAPGELRRLLLGGERLAPELVERTRALLPEVEVVNLYGPTEATANAAWARVPAPGAVTLGRPVAATRLHVLDRELLPVPPGAAGELTVAGPLLARGYLGRPARTAAAFVPDPLGLGAGGRLYRTGDRVRYLHDGRLDFLGRLDDQVKVLGVRLELGEVEAALAGHPLVREAAVVLATGGRGEGRLAAYLVLAADAAAGWREELREHLAGRLPRAALPPHLVPVAALPRLSAGKVDRRELAGRPLAAPDSPGGAPPATPAQEAVAAVWQEVLGVEAPGQEDDFFALGGHSLAAARVASRLERMLGMEVPLTTLFAAPTLAGLARELERLRWAGRSELPPVEPLPRGTEPPLSYQQRRLWLLDRMAPGSATYNVAGAVELVGPLDVAALAGALREVVRRHAALRTVFPAAEGRPRQQVRPRMGVPLPVADLGALAGGAEVAASLARREARRPFQLDRGPLLRLRLLRLAPQRHRLLLTLHHIVCDGWSMGILVREVARLYPGGGLPSPPVQYADYAAWQHRHLAPESLSSQLDHWRRRLREVPVLEIPGDRPRPRVPRGRGGEVAVVLPAALVEALSAASRGRGATLFTAVLAAFCVCLGRWAGAGEVAVGAPVANRRRPEVEDLIGCFVNTLVMRADLTGNPSFGELVARLQRVTLDAHAHSDLPFEALVEELAPRRDLGVTPLFQVMLAFGNAPRPALELPGLSLAAAPVPTGTAKFDLTLSLRPSNGGLEGSLEYDADLFDATTVRRFARRLRVLAEGAAAQPERTLAVLPLLAPAERQQAVVEWNATGAALGEGATLTRMLASQARATPERTAVVAGRRRLSYRELHRRAGALAGRLASLGVGPEARVGLAAERSPEMVVGLVGILAAGGAYVPLDPDHPAERLALVAEDGLAGSPWPVLVGGRGVLPEAALAGRGTLDLERMAAMDPGWPAPAGGEDLGGRPAADDLAYVLYTSGSTGRPKGVMCHHRGVVNRLLWGQGTFRLEPEDRVLQKTPLSFDVSVWELFWPLVAGAQMVLARPGGHRDPSYLARTLVREGITTAHFVPSMLAVFLEALEPPAPALLRRVIASGEALAFALEQRCHERLGAPLFNLYGPTEAAVEVTWWRCRAAADPRPVPIGRPVAATSITVADRGLRPAGIGVPGELLIGGVQVARGYHRRPGLTAERFVPDPWGRVPGGRLYRSGDLVRTLPAGELEFLGRLDHQVKVRGVRVEPGEIEAVLGRHPGVREVAVAAVEGPAAGLRLVAYVVPRGAAVPAAALEAFVRVRLPEALVPAAFVLLEDLPRTASGKLDRRVLPRPDLDRDRAARGPQAPRTLVEELVCQVWAGVLGVAGVRRDEDFFHLGGHSLLAAQAAARLGSALGIEVPLTALFEHPTATALARTLEAALAGGEAEAPPPPLVAVPREAPPPLSFSQQRLWLLERMAPGTAAYSLPVALSLAGDLEPRALSLALTTVAARQEALRTTFREQDGSPVQVIAPPAKLPLPVVDVSGLPAAGRRRGELRRLAAVEAGRPFDLARGPLFRARLLRAGAGEHVLLVTFHHAVSDGWSLGVFAKELSALYRPGGCRLPRLPPLPVQYADYAVWQRRRLAGAALAGELGYWRRRLAGAPEVLALPTDRPRPPVASGRGARLPVRLAPELTAALGALGRARAATPFMVLLAVFAALLARVTGRRDFLLGTPAAGRDRQELEGLLGFFANTLVLRCELTGEPSFGELLARLRGTVVEAQAHGGVPFERLVEEVVRERDPACPPLVQVVLALQSTPAAELDLDGLEVERLELPGGASKFDLTLALAESEGALVGVLEYATDLFDRTTAARLAGHLATLASGAAARPDARLSRLPLLAGAEAHQLRTEWNDTATAYPEAAVEELFLEVAAARPDAVAVAAEGRAAQDPVQHRSYGALEAQSRHLAGRLARLGVAVEDRVGVTLERGPDLPAALVGVLRAGAAYLPLDPSYPAERLAFMARDAGLAAVVIQTPGRGDGAADVLPGSLPREVFPRAAAGASAADGAAAIAPLPVPPAAPERLAHVIYTSGSTGLPKGVGVTHRGVVRLVREAGYVRFGPDRVSLQAATVAFDASTFEIWGPLLSGGRVAVLAPGVPTAQGLGRCLLRQRVEVALLTSRLFELMVDEAPEALATVRELFTGGEAASPAHFARALAPPGPAVVANAYGPTENATITTTHRAAAGRPATAPVPIGRPIGATCVRVLDRRLVPVPMGVPGELATGGAGLARGYHARPALTADRFVPDPWGARPGERLYLTGDLVRLLPDGALSYLGRRDEQVKLRGFRVEPGEVEAALLAHPGVRSATVLARPGGRGEPRLVAYAVATEPAAVPEEEILAFLRARLPAYMVPGALVLLERLPTTPAGKVDRGALPDPETAGEVGGAAPRTPTEEILAGLWMELLGVPAAGVGDDFFALGGHSLLAVRLISRVREAFGVELPVLALFEKPTPAGLARAVEEARRDDAAPAPAPEPVKRGAASPLSFGQERLWFLDQLQPGNPAYNVPLALSARGALSHTALARTFAAVVERHEVLRSRFVEEDDGPMQVVVPVSSSVPGGRWPLPLVDLVSLPEPARRRTAAGLANASSVRPFDLVRGPLLRTALLRLAAEEHLLLAELHHAVTDGWSVGVLLAEVTALYGAHLEGVAPALVSLPLQYADFARYQRRRFAEGSFDRDLAWWRERLAGSGAALELPADRPRPPVQSLRGAAAPFAVDPGLTAALERLARRRGATLFMVLAAAFAELLRRLTGRRDLTLGSPVAGRTHRCLEPLQGFFVNTLVLRLEAGGGTFGELLARVREAALGAYEHAELPFERLVEELSPERRLSHQPLVQVMVALQNAPLGALELPGLTLEVVEVERRTAKADLSLALEERQGRLVGELGYSTDLFDGTTVQRWTDHLWRLLAGAAGAPDAALEALPAFSPAQAHQLRTEWNDTFHPPAELLPVRMEHVVRRRRGAVALVVESASGTRHLSYGELGRRADRLAGRLRGFGVGTDARVGLALERSAEMVVAQLAVLRAGAAFVPMDLTYPAERLAYMTGDAGLSALVVADGVSSNLAMGPDTRADAGSPPAASGPLTRSLLEGLGAPVVALASGGAPPPGGEDTLAGPVAEALAYVIYTSGSTGRPKGVGVSCGALAHILGVPVPAEVTAGDCAAWTGPVGFDISICEVWRPLTVGGRLLLAEGGAVDPEVLGQALRRHRLTSMMLAPGILNLLVDVLPGAFEGLHRLETGGDVASPDHFSRLSTAGPGMRIFNEYGPTENSVYSTFHRYRGPGAAPGPIPIGRPFASTTAYVAGRRLQPALLGVPGELCLGGPRLARGYLGRPAATAGAFVPDPWGGVPGGRLYRTGDRVRLGPGGEVDFLGRLDQQVKVRGFRVEPGEVEAALLEHPAVREAVVVAREDAPGEKRLVGYVVTRDEAAAGGLAARLRAFLAQRLPGHMVPAVILPLPALPLTANRKVDRRALPAPEAGSAETPYAPPASDLERTIAGVWREVLHLPRVGVHDNFFEVGGSSLSAARLRSRLQTALERPVPLVEIFKHPTVAALAESLAGEEAGPDPLAAARARAGGRGAAVARLRRRRHSPGAEGREP